MPPRNRNTQQKTRRFAIEAARLLHDRRCDDVRLLDVRLLSQVCDYVLIGSGTSDRQMKSIATEINTLGRSMGEPAYRTSRDEGGTWIVADFVDLVVHLFEPNQRAYYDLEGLWSDAKAVKWERPAPAKRSLKKTTTKRTAVKPARSKAKAAPTRRRRRSS